MKSESSIVQQYTGFRFEIVIRNQFFSHNFFSKATMRAMSEQQLRKKAKAIARDLKVLEAKKKKRAGQKPMMPYWVYKNAVVQIMILSWVCNVLAEGTTIPWREFGQDEKVTLIIFVS